MHEALLHPETGPTAAATAVGVELHPKVGTTVAATARVWRGAECTAAFHAETTAAAAAGDTKTTYPATSKNPAIVVHCAGMQLHRTYTD